MNIAVYPMLDYAAEVPRIASWFYEQWRSLYADDSLASVERRIRTWLTRNQIPTAFAAVSENEVIGTVALKVRELPDLDFGPWLAGLFVVPEYRRRGIGARLVSAAERQASVLGVRQLYLYTPASEGFYERLGWMVVKRLELSSGAVSVMRKDLPAESALAVNVPEAEPYVGALRERFDPSARLGVPAHITVLSAARGKTLHRTSTEARMATAKQRRAARRNIKKAAGAAGRKRTISRLPKKTRTALGKEGAKAARRKRKKG